MDEHKVPGVRNQRGPDGTCRMAGCGRSVHWDVMADEWVHNFTAAEAERRDREASRDLVKMLVGFSASSPIATILGDTPERVEAYLTKGTPLDSKYAGPRSTIAAVRSLVVDLGMECE